MWNLWLTGWRFSGNLPTEIGEGCPLTINLLDQDTIYDAAGNVREISDEEWSCWKFLKFNHGERIHDASKRN